MNEDDFEYFGKDLGEATTCLSRPNLWHIIIIIIIIIIIVVVVVIVIVIIIIIIIIIINFRKRVLE